MAPPRVLRVPVLVKAYPPPRTLQLLGGRGLSGCPTPEDRERGRPKGGDRRCALLLEGGNRKGSSFSSGPSKPPVTPPCGKNPTSGGRDAWC